MALTWLTREVPILEAVALAETEAAHPDGDWIIERTGLSGEEVAFGIRALVDGGYLAATDLTGSLADRMTYYVDVQLRERGRRTVGTWPKEDGGLDVLLELLAERIEAEPDPEAKSKLTRLREAAQGIGKDVGTSLLSAYLKSVSGL